MEISLPPEQLRFIHEGLKRLKLKSLAAYRETDIWLRVKQLRRTLHVEQCYVCRKSEGRNKGEPLHLHHKTYERLGMELGTDLIWLCGDCHEMLHLTITEAVEGNGVMNLALQLLMAEQEIAKDFPTERDIERAGESPIGDAPTT